MRKFLSTMVIAAAITTSVAGCGSFLALLLASKSTTFHIVNNGQFPVDVTAHYSNDPNVTAADLSSNGNKVMFSLEPNGSNDITHNCADIKAFVIDNALLRVSGDAGPTTSSQVFREGSDFSCGDTVNLSFEHSGLILDFHVQRN